MKGSFTAPAGALTSAVKYASRWLDTKPANPVLGGLLFDVADGRLWIASQSELATARASIDVDGDASGTFIVAGRLLDALIGTIPDKPITFEQDSAIISMSAGRYRATLPAMSESDYPDLAEVVPTVGTVDGTVFVDAVRRIGPTAAKDTTQGVVFSGILFSFDDDPDVAGGEMAYTLTLAATDKLRMARESVEWSPDGEAAPIGESFVLPASVILDAGEAFAGAEPVQIGWRQGSASFTTATRSLVTRTLGGPGDYPDMEPLFDQINQRTHTVTLTVKDLLVPLKRADQLADTEHRHISLHLRPGLLELQSATDGKGGGGEEIDVEYDGPDCTIVGRSAILHGLLATTPSSGVTLHISPNEYKSVHATSADNATWTHVFMPIRHTGRA